ncbi:hypothetical protein [Hyphomonas sp.]|uniref:hypothetical protein n=1 Tax=Hyphomonas sp. TaxID=87 RepID=UPI0025C49C7C|nr:hypothetical protein [Hyphomonas sp.]
MSRIRFAIAAAASTLVLAGCQYWPWKGDTTSTAAPAETENRAEETTRLVTPVAAPAEEAETCAVLESRDWAAWVNRMPGPGAVPTLHVTGKVDVRSGGYTFDWEQGPLDRSATPALRLKLVPRAPDGMATMAITAEEVKFEQPLSDTTYSRVIISCGSITLGEIAGIMDVY